MYSQSCSTTAVQVAGADSESSQSTRKWGLKDGLRCWCPMLKSVRIPYLYETPSRLTATPALIHASVLPLYIFKYCFRDSTYSAHRFVLFIHRADIPLQLLKTRESSSSFWSWNVILCNYPLYPNPSLNFIVHAHFCSIFSADTYTKDQTLTYLPCVQKICITGDCHTLVICRHQIFTSLLFQGRITGT